MPDVEVHQTNQPPERPPTQTEPPSNSVWPVLVVLLVIVIVVVAFVFTRGERSRPADDADVEINLPETRVPEVKVPERIDVNVPDKVDVNVQTTPDKTEPPPAKQNTQPQ